MKDANSLGEDIDIATENSSFFHKVDQFAVEVHLSKTWLDNTAAWHSLGLLCGFLEEAGLEAQHADITPCAPEDEAPGCMSELLEMGYLAETVNVAITTSFLGGTRLKEL